MSIICSCYPQSIKGQRSLVRPVWLVGFILPWWHVYALSFNTHLLWAQRECMTGCLFWNDTLINTDTMYLQYCTVVLLCFGHQSESTKLWISSCLWRKKQVIKGYQGRGNYFLKAFLSFMKDTFMNVLIKHSVQIIKTETCLLDFFFFRKHWGTKCSVFHVQHNHGLNQIELQNGACIMPCSVSSHLSCRL